jgi:predicted transcriptional regulator
MSTITIELDEKRLAELKARAGEAGISVEQFAQEVLEERAGEFAEDDFTPEQRAAIEAGLKALEEGRVVSHEDVFAKLDAKYGW